MVFLGLTSSCELAYMSYVYAKVRDRELYQKMTGIVGGSNLVGKCLASTFSQIAVSYLHIEYSLLVYISLAGNLFERRFHFMLIQTCIQKFRSKVCYLVCFWTNFEIEMPIIYKKKLNIFLPKLTMYFCILASQS